MQPKLRHPFDYYPVWWHHHGDKFCLDEEKTSFPDKRVILTASAATLTIEADGSDNWRINWTIVTYGKTSGSTTMTNRELLSAFTDTGKTADELSYWLISVYGGDYAAQGKCIRWKSFLNIPCPGTGHDGDPNVSILLDEDMAQAVVRLLSDRD
jgi:hypothetical protein